MHSSAALPMAAMIVQNLLHPSPLDRNVPLCFALEAEFTRLGIAVRERVWASRFKIQTQRARVRRCWQASLNRDFVHVVLWFHWSDLQNRGASLSKTGGSG